MHATHQPPRNARRTRRLRAILVLPVLALYAMLSLLGVARHPTAASAASSGTVSGIVRTQSGTPVKAATITIAGLQASTFSDGSYSIANVPFGGHGIVMEAACRTGSGFVNVDGAETVNLTFPDAFNFDDVGGLACRPFGNFALDPLVTNVLPLVGDDESQHITLPFSVLFYGNFKSSLNISTNGYVTFGAQNSLFSNAPLTDDAAPSDSIFAFWDDLVVDQFSAVKTGIRGSTVGQRLFKIRWENVRFTSDPADSRLSIELTIGESGIINIIWTNGVDSGVRPQGASATIGIKAPAGTSSLQQSFNTPTVRSGLGVEYVENAPPVANAGADQTVASGATFPLDASASLDPDGNATMTFAWTQIAGPQTIIQDPKKKQTTVKGVTGPKTLTYRVTATDEFGRSSTDQVTVTVSKPAPK